MLPTFKCKKKKNVKLGRHCLLAFCTGNILISVHMYKFGPGLCSQSPSPLAEGDSRVPPSQGWHVVSIVSGWWTSTGSETIEMFMSICCCLPVAFLLNERNKPNFFWLFYHSCSPEAKSGYGWFRKFYSVWWADRVWRASQGPKTMLEPLARFTFSTVL